MKLSNKQKKYLKRHLKSDSLEKIAGQLGLPKEIIIDYLRKVWGNKKLNRYLEKRETPSSKKTPLFKKFFRQNQTFFLFLALLIGLVYANSLNNGFVSDDLPTIVNHPQLKEFSNLFHSPHSSFPQRVIHWTAVSLFGLKAWAFRLPNLLLHLASASLLFYIIQIITHRKKTALLAAMLFSLHPLLSEPIVWISGMPYLLYSFFFLLSFSLYLQHRETSQNKYLWWSYASFGVSVVATEKAFVLFLIFFLFEFYQKNLSATWKKLLPFVGLGLLRLLHAFSLLGTRIESLKADNYQHAEFISPLVQIPVAIGSYLQLLFWPNKLSLYHTEMSFSTGQYSFFLVLTLLFFALVIWSFLKNKLVFFFLAFFLVALLPTLSPLGVSWIMAERYVYLGSVGIFTALALGFDWLLRRAEKINEAYGRGLYFILAIILIVLSVRTIIRNNDWQNEDTLWLATGRTSPSGQVIHNNLGDVYGRQGNHQKAIEEFQKAIEINPRYADAHHNLANTYREIGEIELAIVHYQKALEINPRLWQSHQNLAAIYLDRGEKEKALAEIDQALTINPQNENLKKIRTAIEKN